MTLIPRKKKTNGIIVSFALGDWSFSSGQYVLELTHGLESEDIGVELWENDTEQVEAERIQIFNTNKVKIYSPSNPDCRFAGKAVFNVA